MRFSVVAVFTLLCCALPALSQEVELECGITNAISDFSSPVDPQVTIQWVADTAHQVLGPFPEYSRDPEDVAILQSEVLDLRNSDCLADTFKLTWQGDEEDDKIVMEFHRIDPGGTLENGFFSLGSAVAGDGLISMITGVPAHGNGCTSQSGEATLSLVNVERSNLASSGEKARYAFHLAGFRIDFKHACIGETAFAEGFIQYLDTPKGEGGGGGGGNQPPPPPFQITLPNVGVEPIAIGNSDSSSMTINTAGDATFNSSLTLTATSDALDWEDFHVSIDPGFIPAPGRGEAEVTITTGPNTFPRNYLVTITAATDTAVTSANFIVAVQCDPPLILGTGQPKPVIVPAGSAATLEVVAQGSGPLRYQWYRGQRGMTRQPVQGAVTSKLVTSAVREQMYWVRISNACGSVDSQAAMVIPTGAASGPARRRSSGN